MKTVRCVNCVRMRPMRKVRASIEDGERVHICSETRPCQVAYYRREVRWSRRMLSLVPRDAQLRSFKARHERLLASWRRGP